MQHNNEHEYRIGVFEDEQISELEGTTNIPGPSRR